MEWVGEGKVEAEKGEVEEEKEGEGMVEEEGEVGKNRTKHEVASKQDKRRNRGELFCGEFLLKEESERRLLLRATSRSPLRRFLLRPIPLFSLLNCVAVEMEGENEKGSGGFDASGVAAMESDLWWFSRWMRRIDGGRKFNGCGILVRLLAAACFSSTLAAPRDSGFPPHHSVATTHLQSKTYPLTLIISPTHHASDTTPIEQNNPSHTPRTPPSFTTTIRSSPFTHQQPPINRPNLPHRHSRSGTAIPGAESTQRRLFPVRPCRTALFARRRREERKKGRAVWETLAWW
ncbi:hypothetical protein Drorol1_Dr00011793 [Drosera rotundifolia]